MIARVEVPGTTIAGIAVGATLTHDDGDFVLTLASDGALPAVVVELRISRLETVTLAGALQDQLCAVSNSDPLPSAAPVPLTKRGTAQGTSPGR